MSTSCSGAGDPGPLLEFLKHIAESHGNDSARKMLESLREVIRAAVGGLSPYAPQGYSFTFSNARLSVTIKCGQKGELLEATVEQSGGGFNVSCGGGGSSFLADLTCKTISVEARLELQTSGGGGGGSPSHGSSVEISGQGLCGCVIHRGRHYYLSLGARSCSGARMVSPSIYEGYVVVPLRKALPMLQKEHKLSRLGVELRNVCECQGNGNSLDCAKDLLENLYVYRLEKLEVRGSKNGGTLRVYSIDLEADNTGDTLYNILAGRKKEYYVEGESLALVAEELPQLVGKREYELDKERGLAGLLLALATSGTISEGSSSYNLEPAVPQVYLVSPQNKEALNKSDVEGGWVYLALYENCKSYSGGNVDKRVRDQLEALQSLLGGVRDGGPTRVNVSDFVVCNGKLRLSDLRDFMLHVEEGGRPIKSIIP